MTAMAVVSGAAELCLIPAVAMLIGGILAFISTPSKRFMAATQHFSAGIILAAIGLELLPKVVHTQDGAKGTICISVGFALGVAIMLGVKELTEGDEDGDSDGDSDGDGAADGDEVQSRPSARDHWTAIRDVVRTETGTRIATERSRLLNAEDGAAAGSGGGGGGGGDASLTMPTGAPQLLSRKSSTLSRINRALAATSLHARMKMRRARKAAAKAAGGSIDRADSVASSMVGPAFPWSLTSAVATDSFMDGLLIGIVVVASQHAGYIMSAATAIEMFFLGLTFSLSVRPQPRAKAWAVTCMHPCILVAGGAVGALGTHQLQQWPNVFGGVVAFGVATLLYLVTHELLVEAHENDEEHSLGISIWLFIGFLVVLITARLFPDDKSMELTFA